MLIGKKSDFAIEWDVSSIYDGFVYGHFRFWIAGEAVGDWNEEVVIGVLIYSAKIFLRFKGDRYLFEADHRSSEELWNHIVERSNSDDFAEMQIALEENYRARFFVHEIADDSVATVGKIILADRYSGGQRLLWKHHDSTVIREIELPKLLVDNLIQDFVFCAEEIKTR